MELLKEQTWLSARAYLAQQNYTTIDTNLHTFHTAQSLASASTHRAHKAAGLGFRFTLTQTLTLDAPQAQWCIQREVVCRRTRDVNLDDDVKAMERYAPTAVLETIMYVLASTKQANMMASMYHKHIFKGSPLFYYIFHKSLFMIAMNSSRLISPSASASNSSIMPCIVLPTTTM